MSFHRRASARIGAARRLLPAALLAAAGFSVQAGSAVAQPPPTPPTGLSATAVSAVRIDLRWEQFGGSSAKTYNVYRDGTHIANSKDIWYYDTDLQPAVTYTYTVTGVDDKGRESDPSAPASATTFPESTPPTKPTGLSATAVDTIRIDLNWSASSDPETGVELYQVYRDGSMVGTTDDTSFRDTGLAPETEYEYRVSAVNGAGMESARSDPARATTLSPPDTSPPTTPAGLSATAVSDSEVQLTWGGATDPESGVSEYRVYRNGALVSTTTATSFRDTGLAPETEYEYRVSAVNGEGLEGTRSDPARATTLAAPDTSPPTTPAGLSATALSATDVQLTWTAATDPESGVSEYRVYRNGAPVAGVGATSFVDPGLTPETDYEYRVSAVNGEGLEGGRSARVEVRTPPATDPTPPSAPSGLTAGAVSSSRIDLEWLPAVDAESGVDGYRVYRDDTLLAEVSGLLFADVDVLPSTAYSYQVSAVNGSRIEGPRSAPVTTTTPPAQDLIPPAPPTGLRVVTP